MKCEVVKPLQASEESQAELSSAANLFKLMQNFLKFLKNSPSLKFEQNTFKVVSEIAPLLTTCELECFRDF